jgi:tetratricopeptide (TPR) repeat protein
MTTPDTPEEKIARARALVATDARAAFGELRTALAYPAAPEGALLHDALDVMREIAEELVGDHLAGVLAWARDHADDPEALYDAGYALYEQKLHDLAATLLARADRIAPGSPTVVTELSANLEALMLHRHAAEALRASGLVETEPMVAYLYGYNALMSGDVEAARPIGASLRALDDHSLAYMGSALAGMVARADAIRGAAALDRHDLAGWHLVVNGGVLLHLSPHGYEDAMRGRYAYVADTYARLHEGLDRLALVLSTAGIAPPRVFALPDRSSRVVALAAARILGVPCEPWPAGGDERAGVIVAYDLDRVGVPEVLEQLRDHRPGQVLFAHASCWTDPFPFTPDVTTFLYQASPGAPWEGGHMRYDEARGGMAQSAPDDAPEEALAARIVEAAAADESVSSREQLAALVTAARGVGGDAAAGIYRSEGARLRQRAGSPVQSNRFL